jgi:arylsulfatase A-like enzyme
MTCNPGYGNAPGRHVDPPSTAQDAGMPKPHILLISLDECRWDALGCYGGRVVATPRIDALAAAGLRCTEAFTASPLCLPSRCALLTGQYPHRHGAYSNFRVRLLDPAAPNLYNQLRAGGYAVAHAGKCHYAPVPYGRNRDEAIAAGWPEARATALSLGIERLELGEGKGAGLDTGLDDYARDLHAAGVVDAYEAAWKAAWHGTNSFAFPGPEEIHDDAWTARRSIAVIEEHDPRRPLFLWCSFPGPHYPHDPPAKYLDRVDRSRLPMLRYQPGEFDGADKVQADAFHGRIRYGLVEGAHNGTGTKSLTDAEWVEVQSHYFAKVALLDDWIGRMVDAAERRLGSDLLVILTSDHGDCMGAHRLWGKNRCAYDEVLRVPLILRGRAFAPASTTDARVCLTDLFPTLLRIADLPAQRDRDGRDLRDSLVDGGHRLLLASNDGLLVAHDRRWKLIIDRPSGISELYDRGTDPGETVNRISDPRCLRERQRLESLALIGLMEGALA